MSHVAKFELGVMQLEELKPAFEALGWLVQKDTTCRGVYGKHALVAVNPQQHSYDVVLDVTKDGKVSLRHEAYLQFDQTRLGREMELLKQQYQLQVAKKMVLAKGGRLKSKCFDNRVMEVEIEIEA